jgi:hypothetical protein
VNGRTVRQHFSPKSTINQTPAMASFTTRVELHNATYSDYETLHSAMESEGFSRTITSDVGFTYQLPTAEYDRLVTLTRSQVLESAKRAASTTGKKYLILVTESSGRTWTGLKIAE